MTDILPEPEDAGAPLASEAHTSFAGQLGAEWANTLDPKNSLSGGYIFRRFREAAAGGDDLGPGAGGDVDVFSGQSLEERQSVFDAQRAAIPDTSIEDAKARVKQEGLEKDLHLPDQPSIKSPVLDMMIQEAHDRRDREAAIARGPNSFYPNALGFITSLGVGMIDPVNALAFSLPVLGEARTAAWVARAGDSMLARAGVKAGIGAVQGAAGTAILQPADWWLHTRDGQDYTMAEALKSVVMGAGIGGLAHAGIGAYGDIRSHLRQLPLEGSPEDLVWRGLMIGTHVHADQLAEEGVPIGDVPGIDPQEVPGITPGPAPAPDRPFPGDIPIHPAAEVLADLPPAAREDAVHAAMASVIDGTPVRAAEMLQIAADHDKRIAEAFEPERIRAATIEHDGAVFEGRDHAEALEKLHAEQGGLPIGGAGPTAAFATTKGRIVSPEEARQIANSAARHDVEHGNSPPYSGIVAGDVRGAPASGPGASPEAAAERAAQPAIPDLVTAPKPRGRAAAHPDTLSLNEHLASKGGLRPDPELKAIYGSDRGPFIPGFGPLIRKSGMSLDDALSSAKQHGYMFDPHDAENGSAGAGGRTSHGLTPNDLLDHLDAENRGQKLYKPTHVEKTKFYPDQEKHVIMGALEQELEAQGHNVSEIDPDLLNRTVEIVRRDGVTDMSEAYERAIMEDAERYDAIANARRSDPRLADIPGWDKPADAGAAPGDGRSGAVDRGQAGRPDHGAGGADGQKPPADRGRNLQAAAADPRWRQLADVKPEHSTPEAIAESQAGDAVAEPASVTAKAVSAIEQAASDAEASWRKIEASYTEAERAVVNDALDKLNLDQKTREDLISEGAACLAAAEA